MLCFISYVVVSAMLLDVFKPDENFTENEEKYKQLKKGNFGKFYNYIVISRCLSTIVFCTFLVRKLL